MKSLTQSTRLDYFRSAWSLLTAIPFSNRDVFYKDIMGLRLKHTHKSNINYSLKKIIRHGKNYEIPWIQTSYGAYAIVERDIPFLHEGLPRSHEGVAVLYSDKPKSLKSVLSGDISKHADIDILSHQKKSDFEILNELSYERLINRIVQDHQKLKEDIQSHETFIEESDKLWRSDSCIIFALPHKTEADHYDIYQYFNPLGEDGLFIKADMLDNKKFRSVLKSVSLKTTKHPVAKSHLTKWMHDRANHAARNIMNGHAPDKIYRIRGNGVKKAVKSATQPMFHTLARLDLVAVILGVGIAAVSAYGFVFFASLFAAAKTLGVSSLFTKTAISSLVLGNNPISKMTNGAFRAISKLVHNNKTRQVKRFYDYKVDFTPYPHFITNVIRATKAKPEFFNDIKFVPYKNIESAVGVAERELEIHDEKAEQQWLTSQKCYTDCHKGASIVSLVQNQTTNAIAFQLIDGRRSIFIHEEQGQAIIKEGDEAKKIRRESNGTYTEHSVSKSLITQYKPHQYKEPEHPPLRSRPIASDQILAILPESRAKRRAVKARNAFETSSTTIDKKIKSPRPLESVGHDAPAHKL